MRLAKLGLVAALGATLYAGAVRAAAASEPAPELTPRQVVEAQLAALRANDEPTPDAGIRTAFRFASPENRRTTGPIDHFIAMVKNPVYAPLLNHRAAHLSETTEKDELARIKVTVLPEHGEEAAFVWILARVRAEGCDGCWMTSTVMRVESKHSPFSVAALRER
ncbi:MAG: DUF4864 domain-containing protein [Bryobacterales bacterium]|nr:DUF4864 domain-containing protein [Acidobacteriota bacterium]MCB9385447.1 DUF4864 domain-containing protein [Bryobacterales bacterium]